MIPTWSYFHSVFSCFAVPSVLGDVCPTQGCARCWVLFMIVFQWYLMSYATWNETKEWNGIGRGWETMWSGMVERKQNHRQCIVALNSIQRERRFPPNDDDTHLSDFTTPSCRRNSTHNRIETKRESLLLLPWNKGGPCPEY